VIAPGAIIVGLELYRLEENLSRVAVPMLELVHGAEIRVRLRRAVERERPFEKRSRLRMTSETQMHHGQVRGSGVVCGREIDDVPQRRDRFLDPAVAVVEEAEVLVRGPVVRPELDGAPEGGLRLLRPPGLVVRARQLADGFDVSRLQLQRV